MNYYVECWKKYAVFSGRARRKEYWMFFLFNVLVSTGIGFVLGIVGAVADTPELALAAHLYTLAALLPSMAVWVRRMHDTGRSGWWWLLALIPFVGAIVLLVFLCQDSQPGANQYGPNPKG